MENAILASHDKSPCNVFYQKDGNCDIGELIKDLERYFSYSCKKEECIKLYKKEKKIKNLDDDLTFLSESTKKRIFNPAGPANSTKLISNFNIDDYLSRLCAATISKNYGVGPTKHINFDMRDFMDTYFSDLKSLSIRDLKKKNYKHFCCVLNTDVWAGDGKHWVCIFGTLSDKNIIEYFNSSSNGLNEFQEIRDWVARLDEPCELIEVVKKRLQKSDTECGMWCLWYIKKRIEGEAPDYFFKNNIKDEDIIDARRYTFFNDS